MRAIRHTCAILAGLLSSPWQSVDSLAAENTVELMPKQIQVDGVTVFSDAVIDEVVNGYRNRPLEFIDLQKLRIDLTRLYTDAGYVTSGVVIPDQPIGEVLRLQVIESELTRIEVVGDTRLRSAYLASRVRHRSNGALNLTQLRSTMRWLQLDPNVNRIDAELLAGERAGESILKLSVDDAPRFTVGLAVDNYRSASLGAEALNVVFTGRNFSGLGDSTYLSVGASDGSDALNARVDLPLSRRNLVMGAYFARSDARVIEERFAGLDIESQSESFGIDLQQPLIDRLNQSLSLTLGIEKRRSESSLFGIPFSFSPGAEDGKAETSTLELTADWNLQWEAAAVSVRTGYRRGFGVLGATGFNRRDAETPELNPTGADGKFGRFRIQGLGLYRLSGLFANLSDGYRLVVRSNVQLATDPLMSLEKLAIGGRYTVRGFRENTFVRDSGVSASAELQIPLFGNTTSWRNAGVTAIPFYDVGWSWDEEPVNPGASSTSVTRRISSAGLGLLWQPARGLRAEVYWAEPLHQNRRFTNRTGNDYDLQDDGIHFSMSYTHTF